MGSSCGSCRRGTPCRVHRGGLSTGVIAEEIGIAPQNTYRSLARLFDAGVLVESTHRKRNRMWLAPEALGALDRFAASDGRRTRARH